MRALGNPSVPVKVWSENPRRMEVVMDYEDYKAAHVALWDWLANNPGKDKDDWPGWQDTSSSVRAVFDGEEIENYCFMCAWYSKTGGGCRACAITRNHGLVCHSDIADDPACWGLFAQWCKAMGDYGDEPDYEEACKIAALIRDSWEY